MSEFANDIVVDPNDGSVWSLTPMYGILEIYEGFKANVLLNPRSIASIRKRGKWTKSRISRIN